MSSIIAIQPKKMIKKAKKMTSKNLSINELALGNSLRPNTKGIPKKK